jgi:uncharacterized DUF497 family protein
MSQIEFEWDENKNQKNIAKHKVSFEEAKSAFYDPNALVIHDPRNSDDNEDRFLLLGMSMNLKLLIVCHCYRANDEVIRIISARKADKNEEKAYGR